MGVNSIFGDADVHGSDPTLVTFATDANGNVTLMGPDGESLVVISADAPDDDDGRVNGTIYFEIAE
jgi:hypothetical protein